MPFFKVPLHPDEEGNLMYDFVIIEEEDVHSAYDRIHNLPPVFGDGTDDGTFDMAPIIEVQNPLSEPWPIFTSAYFAQLDADRAKRIFGR